MFKNHNYTGPYWSNGKFQTSVEFGEAPTFDEVDAASRLHDSAYAKYQDQEHRRAADRIYYDTLKKIDTYEAELARNAVLYGNFTMDSATNLLNIANPFGLVGILKGAVKNALWLNDEITGEHKKYQKEVSDYYLTDPKLKPLATSPSPTRGSVYDPSYDFILGIGEKVKNYLGAQARIKEHEGKYASQFPDGETSSLGEEKLGLTGFYKTMGPIDKSSSDEYTNNGVYNPNFGCSIWTGRPINKNYIPSSRRSRRDKRKKNSIYCM